MKASFETIMIVSHSVTVIQSAEVDGRTFKAVA